MHVSFGSRIRRGFGFRLGWRLRGPAALVAAMVAGMFYLMWWSILGCAYITWACCWLTWQGLRGFGWLMWQLCRLYCLPFKWIARLIREHKNKEE